MNYRSDLEGLRGLAVCAVVLFHFYPSLLSGGFTGVDVFFALSGYLITYKIISESEEKQFSLINFYSRRILRLFPALSFVLLIFCLIAYFIFTPDELIQLAKNTISGIGFHTNISISKVGYFTEEANLNPLMHLWSLAVEEQFYILWPLVLLLFLRYRLFILIITFFLIVCSLTYSFLIDNYAQNGFFSLIVRSWELMIGALIAIFQSLSTYKIKYLMLIKNNSSIVGVILILFSFFFNSSSNINSIIYTFLPIFGTCLIIAAGQNSNFNILLNNRILRFIGKISYPLYLWHWPIFSLSKIIEFPIQYEFLAPILITISVFLSFLTYKYIEQSCRKLFSFYPLYVILFLIFIMGTMVVYSFFAIKYDGFPDRLDNNASLISQYGYDERSGYRVTRCTLDTDQNGQDFAEECNAAEKNKINVFIWGDSTGSHLYPGLLQTFMPDKYTLSQYTAAACKPAIFISSHDKRQKVSQCENINSFVTQKLMLIKPEILILSSIIGDVSQHELVELINVAHFAKINGVKKVVIVGPNFKFYDSVPKIISRNLLIRKNIEPGKIKLNSDDLMKIQQVDHYLEVKSKDVGYQYVSTIKSMCKDNYCRVMYYGLPAYWDNMHLTDGGSFYISHFILIAATSTKPLEYTEISSKATQASVVKISTLEDGIEFKKRINQAKSYGKRGNESILKNNFHDALIYFTKAIELDPITVEYYAKRGDVYGQLGDLQNAYLDYGIFVKMTRNNVGKIYGLTVLANLAEGLEMWIEALDVYDQLLLLNPDNISIKYKQLEILRKINKK